PVPHLAPDLVRLGALLAEIDEPLQVGGPVLLDFGHALVKGRHARRPVAFDAVAAAGLAAGQIDGADDQIDAKALYARVAAAVPKGELVVERMRALPLGNQIDGARVRRRLHAQLLGQAAVGDAHVVQIDVPDRHFAAGPGRILLGFTIDAVGHLG